MRKYCLQCGKGKSLSSFALNGPRRRPRCKVCENRTHRASHNHQAHKARMARMYVSTPERFRESSWQRQGIQITYAEYLALKDKQKGRCRLCDFEPTGSRRQLAVDHCHRTGRIRGLLCTACNVAIGRLGDTKQALERVIRYVEGGDVGSPI